MNLELEEKRENFVTNISIPKDRMLRITRDCTALAEDQNIPPKDRIAVEQSRIDIILRILKMDWVKRLAKMIDIIVLVSFSNRKLVSERISV